MESKICTKCRIEKPIAEFSTREKGRRLLKSNCNDCEKARGREYSRARCKTPEGQYKQHKDNAKTRGISFDMSFEDWFRIWEESGKLPYRGKGKDKYCMCRVNDDGAYSVGNVFISTNSYNLSSGNKGKAVSAETREKISAAHIGKPHPWSAGENNPMHRPEVKAKMRELQSGGKHYSARKVITPSGVFNSGVEAAAALNIPKPTIYWRCKHNKSGYSFA